MPHPFNRLISVSAVFSVVHYSLWLDEKRSATTAHLVN